MKLLLALPIFLSFWFVYEVNAASSTVAANLTAVVVLYRHGERSLRNSFPYDRFFKPQYWPEGINAFLNTGKVRHYKLGLWFRDRYGNFVSDTFNKSEIKVYSAETENSLMSAQCNLAGMYRLENDRQWYEDLPWDPVPIHTRPEDEDAEIAMLKPCPRYSELYNEVIQSEVFKKIEKDNAEMMSYLSEKTGWEMNILYVRNLYSIFDIYEKRNSSYIPSWASKINQTKFRELSGMAWARETYTPELKRLKAGPFFYDLFQHFDQVVAQKPVPRLKVLFSSIAAISAILNTMDLYDNYPIDFGATLIWELSNNNGEYLVNMYYKDDRAVEPQRLKFKDCSNYACAYSKVKDLISDHVEDPSNWNRECYLNHLN